MKLNNQFPLGILKNNKGDQNVSSSQFSSPRPLSWPYKHTQFCPLPPSPSSPLFLIPSPQALLTLKGRVHSPALSLGYISTHRIGPSTLPFHMYNQPFKYSFPPSPLLFFLLQRVGKLQPLGCDECNEQLSSNITLICVHTRMSTDLGYPSVVPCHDVFQSVLQEDPG